MVDFDAQLLDDPRAFEQFLRGQGFSRSRAKEITAKGFDRVPVGRSIDVAALVSCVQRRQATLQKHGLAMHHKGAGGSRLAAIGEALDIVRKGYRAIRPTRMPLFVMEGRSKRYSLGLVGSKTRGRLVARSARDFVADFEATIGVWSWSHHGPIWQERTVPSRNGAPVELMRGDFGSLDIVEKWLVQEWDRLEATGALQQFDRVLGRLYDIAAHGFSPRGTVTFNKLKAAQRVPIIRGEGATVKEERPFYVTIE